MLKKMTIETQAHQFFHNQVLPSVRDWEENHMEEHRAMSVAVNLNHMADRYWYSFDGIDPSRLLGANNLSAFRNALCAKSNDFSLIRDVADAHKHVKLDRSGRNLTNADQTTVARLGWGVPKWGEGRWGSSPEVVVTFDDGSKHHFSTAVRKSIELWESMLF
jgi:hypothetical protein